MTRDMREPHVKLWPDMVRAAPCKILDIQQACKEGEILFIAAASLDILRFLE